MEKAPSDRLEQVRKDLGWSYRKLATFFGVGVGTAHNWANARTPVPDAVQAQIPALEHAARERSEEFTRQLVTIGVIGFGVLMLKWLNRDEND